MQTLREIYTELVAEHAPGSTGEMVFTFSDKGAMHSYIEYYEKWFEPQRDASSILEIGVMTGGSALLWRKYFRNVLLTGVDLRVGFNQELSFQEEIGADWHWGVDSTDPEQVPDIIKPHHFVIDDGAHDVASQIATFKNYWHLVKPGGTYFIEDIESDDSTQTISLFLKDFLKDQPHSTDYFRGFPHRQDDRILAITKDPK
jgi:cephalosporin hydroxylase